MRKHRLYGVSLAMLAATGVAVSQVPTGGHDATAATNHPRHRRRHTRSHHAELTRAERSARHRHEAELWFRFIIGARRTETRRFLTALEWDAWMATAVRNESAGAQGQQSAGQFGPSGTGSQQSQASWQAPSAPPSAGTTSGGAGGAFAALRSCESGGNYSENTGNGFYGAYQFSQSTWQSLGYSGLPSDAPPSVQDAAAQYLESQAGWAPWPGCSSQLGL